MKSPRTTRRQSTTEFKSAIPMIAPGKLEKRNRKGETPLHLAVMRTDPVAVEALLMSGAAVNSFDHFGWTPLHEAANHGDVPTIKALLKHPSADVNTVGAHEVKKLGMTPLHDAAGNGNTEVAQLMIRMGADPFLVDAKGKTALDCAVAEGHEATAEYLRGVVGAAEKRRSKERSTSPTPMATSPTPMESDPRTTATSTATTTTTTTVVTSTALRTPRKSTTQHSEPQAEPTTASLSTPVELSDARLRAVRAALGALFKRSRTDTILVQDVVAELNSRKSANALTAWELGQALRLLADDNAIMVTEDDNIILI